MGGAWCGNVVLGIGYSAHALRFFPCLKVQNMVQLRPGCASKSVSPPHGRCGYSCIALLRCGYSCVAAALLSLLGPLIALAGRVSRV